jgi:hypothetical protein
MRHELAVNSVLYNVKIRFVFATKDNHRVWYLARMALFSKFQRTSLSLLRPLT